MTICHRFGATSRRIQTCAGCALALFAVAAPSHGGLILGPGQYVLQDHPDANVAPPGYGLRLDELIDVTGGHDVFTFSFDHPDADMRLDITEIGVDEFQLHIYGTAYGGLVVNHDYDPMYSGLVDLDFVYMMAHTVDGDDDLIVTTPNFTNTGFIVFDQMKIDLFDRANAEGFTFRLGNEDDDAGHRGFDGVSGWGWLDHTTAGVHVYQSDWLFTVVPTPGTTMLMSIAIAVVLSRVRRR